MGSYYHKFWICPFYKWDEKEAVHCEGGKLKFPMPEISSEYMSQYCASFDYKNCTIAKMLIKKEEEK